MAKIVQDVIFRVELDDDKAQKQAKDFQKNVGGATKGTNGLTQSLKGVAVAAAAAFSVREIIQFGKAAVQAAGNYEQLRVSFTTFLGSAEKAEKTLKELERFSTVTPFTPDQVNKAGQALLAFGVEQENLVPTLEKVGTVSAAVGKDFNELAVIFGKARTSGQLFSEDINQLTEAGVPIIDELARALGKPTDEIKKLASEGKIGFDALEAAFTNLTSEGGRFFGLLEGQSETLNGKISTLTGVFEVLQREIGEALLPIISELVDGLLENQDIITEIAGAVVDYIQTWREGVAVFEDLLQETGLLSENQSVLEGALQGVLAVVNAVVKALQFYIERLNQVKNVVTTVGDLVGITNNNLDKQSRRLTELSRSLFTYGERLGLTADEVRRFQLENQDLLQVFSSQGTQAGIEATKKRLAEYKDTLKRTEEATTSFVKANLKDGKDGKGNKVTDAAKLDKDEIDEGLDAYIESLEFAQDKTSETGLEITRIRDEEQDAIAAALLRTQSIEDQIRDEQLEKDRLAAEERRNIRQETAEAAVQGLAGVLDISATLTNATLQQDIANLEKVKAARISAAEGSAEAIAKIEEEFQQRRDALERAALLKEKQRRVALALANQALAITNYFSTTAIPFPANLLALPALLAPVISAVADVQASTLGSFHTGGYTGAGAKMSPAGIVHKDEFVINQEKTRKFRPLLDAIHEGRIDEDRVNAMLNGGGSSVVVAGNNNDVVRELRRLYKKPSARVDERLLADTMARKLARMNKYSW